MDYLEAKQAVKEAAKQFPEEFGLQAFPGERFSISEDASYVNDKDVVMLYVYVKKGDRWMSFAKGTVAELLKEVVR